MITSRGRTGNVGDSSAGYRHVLTRTISRRLTAVLTASALVLAACGGSSTPATDTGARPDLAPADPASAALLPAVTVWDVGESEWVQLADYLPSDRPLLLWFYAPH
jgi:hypothetical protein